MQSESSSSAQQYPDWWTKDLAQKAAASAEDEFFKTNKYAADFLAKNMAPDPPTNFIRRGSRKTCAYFFCMTC
jgi:hypothetical protein